jgi:hypothetical protein
VTAPHNPWINPQARLDYTSGRRMSRDGVRASAFAPAEAAVVKACGTLEDRVKVMRTRMAHAQKR